MDINFKRCSSFVYHSTHRVIKKKPVDVNNSNVDEIRKTFHQKPNTTSSDLKIGDKVRISKVKSVFEKGYLPNWTDEIFSIIKIDKKFHPTTYKLLDYDNEIIEGSFYRHELEPIIHNDDDNILIEKILKRKKYRSEAWCLVKWVGYPSSMNSWIRCNDIFKLSSRE